MNLKELARIPAFEHLRQEIKGLEVGAVNVLCASAKTEEMENIKFKAGILEGIQRVQDRIDKAIKESEERVKRSQ